jgi:FkbM family methyltransferase
MIDVASSRSEVRQTLRALCPQPLLNWREARFYGRYGEVELHLLEFLCRRDADSIDVGANDGSYVHYMRRWSRHVHAYEPTPSLAAALRQKFPRRVTVQEMALSDRKGTIHLHSPVVNGVVVTGCSTVSDSAAATYPGHRSIDVPMDRLDDVYSGKVGFMKIDVEGHEQAVLDGAIGTVRRCRPRLLVEIDERLSPGGLLRARKHFGQLGYLGYFVHQGVLEPAERFAVDRMQDLAHLPDLTAPLQARQRFGCYIYNFIWLPTEEDPKTLALIQRRLQNLAGF